MNLEKHISLWDLRMVYIISFILENRTTNYKDDYIMKSCDKGFPNTEEAKHFELYIANPRKAHFDLGEDKINY